MVVVDVVSGVSVQTVTVLRQAINERIKPVLFLNKLDRVFTELQYTAEDVYQAMRRSIESVNHTLQMYHDGSLGDITLSPELGNVGFGSGLHAWGFTLDTFAKMLCGNPRMGSKKALTKKLWGNNCWHPRKGWVKHDPAQPYTKDGKKEYLKRGFCEFIMEPLIKLVKSMRAGEEKLTWSIIEGGFGKGMEIHLSESDKELAKDPSTYKKFYKLVMRTWLPAGDALLDLIADHLPSPVEAQKYRAEVLYSGDKTDEIVKHIETANVDGPLMMYISKMVPAGQKGAFWAFGRVFSGKVSAGQTVRILGSEYDGKKKDLYVTKVQSVKLMLGGKNESIPHCGAGNMCALVGVSKFLNKCGTITTDDKAAPFHTMKFSVSAVVRVAVQAAKLSELPKLLEGLKRLSQTDQLVKIEKESTGENVIGCAGELHMEIILKDLRKLSGIKIKTTEPIVSYAEGIKDVTGTAKGFPEICVSKSANKLNRLYMSAQPLSAKLCDAIDQGVVQKIYDVKKRARLLHKEHGWNKDEARKIWCFGCPPDALPNVVVDRCKGAQYMTEIKDHVVGGFRGFTKRGALCGSVVRGFRANIEDVKLHQDNVHRGASQIIRCAERVFSAC
eukprot:UN06114